METPTQPTLTEERVDWIFLDCLFGDDEDTDGYVEAEGIVNTVGFHPGRLDGHKIEIEAMLGELPDEFQQSGGGWSFLNACYDKHANQWTGLHLRMEQLFLLGIAIGKVTSQVPKELWAALPGGMPYYVVKEE